ncbi:MAG TPA: HAD-IIIC family phosphatase [Bryobacteraceae bacterium]|nr:HAD-IIIC family phosphatase [Bryobacteraceae bacterium]
MLSVLNDTAFRQEAVEKVLANLPSDLSIESLPDTANATYLRARLAETGEEACAHWERFFTLQPGRDPFHLLAHARSLGDLERYEEAALQLRRALEQRPRYAFYTRAEKLVSRVSKNIGTHLRECRIGILGHYTTSLLAPVLRACMLRDRVRAEIYEGLYGSVQQEILDPSSGLARFKPDIVFLPASWRDLHLPGIVENEAEYIDAAVEEAKQRWQRLSEAHGCHVVQFAYDFPADEAYGYFGSSLRGGRTRVLEHLNAALREAAPSNVSILDAPALQRAEGGRWQDDMQWHSFQQHPATESLPALADLMSAHVRAVLGLTRKVLIADLDNTLWKGIIGEEGLQGIQIGPGSPAGEAHSRLQQYMFDLKAHGILLAVASKNNHEDACLPFQKHEQMLLRLEDFAAFEANWNDKATSIREIARKLSLGLDSFVFLDDNPLEREWVRSQLPDVAVVELGDKVFEYVQNLDRPRYFFGLTLSAEDMKRADQYRSEAARKHLQATSESLDQFLAQLQLRASIAPVNPANLARVTQLTNKTNQFNLTTRRYTESQVEQLAADPTAWTAAFHLADRMGDYGLIGVIFCHPAGSSDVWEIDTWLMSCRVLGRQMEKFMFDRLVEAAQARGIREIIGVFRPTAKNTLVRDLYDQFHFTRVSEGSEEVRYSLRVPAEAVNTATHVRAAVGTNRSSS